MGSRSGELRELWGTEERTFRLTVARWEKVQEATNAGPPEIARRLSLAALAADDVELPPLVRAASGRLGQWRVQDLRAVYLHGLIGGGMLEEDAERLCRELFDERPLSANVALALRIVMASLFGPEEEPVGGGDGSGETPGSAA